MQRRPGLEKKSEIIVKREKLKHLTALEITDKTSKGQLPTITGWNLMRERLIEIGEMEVES